MISRGSRSPLANRKTLYDRLKPFLFSGLLLILPTPVRALTVVNPWKPIFQGIDYATGFTDEPVFQKINGLRVDLSNPSIRFFSTPDNGAESLETTARTTSQFLDEYNLQVAINANFFAPCCTAAPEPKDLIGLAVSNGNIVSPNEGLTSLLLTEDNRARIELTTPGEDLSNIFTAVSAGPRLLNNGNIDVPLIPPDSFSDFNPRTAVGISEDGKYLILMTIDGRQRGVSEGATLYQTAEWLLRLGSFHGLNLDGGGSTTMVREGAGGIPIVLNIPSGGGIERFNGNNFGVFAVSLSVPEPGTLTGIVIFGLSVLVLVKKRTEN
jgi:hypothetical protein